MRLVEVSLTNFRGYRNTTRVDLTPLTVLIGKNDAGKSTVLDALEVFFNEGPIEAGDCCVHTGDTTVRIGCVFEDLPSSLVLDEQVSTSLGAEHLLRADGRLEIVKAYNCASAKGKLTSVIARAHHPAATGVDDLLSLKVTELRARATSRSVDLAAVNQTIKAELRAAIWTQAIDLELVERDVSLMKESGKDAWDQIQLQLPAFALFKSDRASTDQDAEAQDPLKAAIKEAIRHREAELSGILSEIKAELATVASRTVDKIRELSPTLASQLSPDVKQKGWDSLFSVSLTGDDAIPLNKRGSGTRRMVLLSFFRAKADGGADAKDTGVIYAIEEPETSQHPNHQILLLDAFEDLVEQGLGQVLLTTHTPTLARRVDRNCLRFVEPGVSGPSIHLGSDDATLEAIKHTLGILADHDVRAFIGVEGKHDMNFLKLVSSTLSQSEQTIPDLARAETEGRIMFIPLSGSNMDLWATRLAELDRPEFYLTDRDNRPPLVAKYQSQVTDWTNRGCTAWITSKRELENYLHPSILSAIAPAYSGTGVDQFEDVPLLFAEALYSPIGGVTWAQLSPKSKKRKASDAKHVLNTTCASQMTSALLSASDLSGEVRLWLTQIGQAIS